MKKLLKYIIMAGFLLIAGNAFAGSISNLMPYMILDSSSAMGAVSCGVSRSQDNFSLYNAVPASEFYVISNSFNNGLTRDDMTNNSLVLAQESMLCNAIFRNNS